MTTATTTQKTSILRLIVLFVVMFASTSAFAQDTTNTVAPTSTSTAVASTSTDFAVWFVGNAKQTTTKTSGTASEKKQLINAGFITTNVLIKKVVKKIMSQENAVA